MIIDNMKNRNDKFDFTNLRLLVTMNGIVYRDFIAEISAIRATSQKKLLKKPNLNEALKQFNELAAAMQDMEMFDQAAYCHKEMAGICKKLENHMMERQHLLKAANLFCKAVNERNKMHLICLVSTELVQLMEECYLTAIDKILKQGSPRITGLIYIEMANQFDSLQEFNKSYAALIKANKFLQGDIYSQIIIVEKMVDLMSKQSVPENAIVELKSIWNSLPKSQIGEVMIPVLLALEGRILFLQLLYSIPNIPQFPYDGQWRNAYGKSSVANKEIFLVFSQFVAYIRSKNYYKAIQIYLMELKKIMDAKGKSLGYKLLDSLNCCSNTLNEFDYIIASEEMNEIQKRQTMLETISSLNYQI